jgi:hypothetical protein
MLVERIHVPTHVYPASNADKTNARIKGTATSIAVSPEGDRRERKESATPEQQENAPQQDNNNEQENLSAAELATPVDPLQDQNPPKTGEEGPAAKPHIDVRA